MIRRYNSSSIAAMAMLALASTGVRRAATKPAEPRIETEREKWNREVEERKAARKLRRNTTQDGSAKTATAEKGGEQ